MTHLFDPITIGNTTLKNRIVFAPPVLAPTVQSGTKLWRKAAAA